MRTNRLRGSQPTALWLEWLDAHPPVAGAVVDFGCGSGVLALAALRLGARSASCFDIDPQALIATRDQPLHNLDLRWSDETALTVVMASKGYPGAYEKGTEICNLDAAAAVDGVQIFHAGTERRDGKLLAAGGRVLNITALGKDVAQAQARAYKAVDRIDWPGGFCRRDIGWRALSR